MQNELSCPECGYKTPFYTCMRCGATIKAQPPEKDKPESEHIPRYNQGNIPDHSASPMPKPAYGQDSSGATPVHYGEFQPAAKKAAKYNGPPATLKYIFIVLGVVLALLKVHILVVQYKGLSPLVNLPSISSYSPLPNGITD